MKAIINGFRYDTDNAALIGENSFGHPSDFKFWEEALYRTASGRYFLSGAGNARSHYATSDEPGRHGPGTRITSLTPEEARAWAEKNLTPAATEAAFAELIKDA